MTSLHLVVDNCPPTAAADELSIEHLAPLFDDLTPLRDLGGTGVSALLRDLSFALADLYRGPRQRAVVPTEANGATSQGSRAGAAWEIGIERDAGTVLISLFRRGPRPQVAQTDREVPFGVARRSILDGIGGFAVTDRGLSLAREALLACPGNLSPSSRRSCLEVAVTSTRRAPISLSAALVMRKPSRAPHSDVARADLHALLFRGDLVVSVRDSRREVKDVHLFLFVEQLVALAQHALDARPSGRGLLRRVKVAEASCGVQVDRHGETTLLASDGDAAEWRLPSVPAPDFARAVLSFGRRLIKQVLSVDRSQKGNLRVSDLRRDLRQLGDRMRGSGEASPMVNGSPESYRAFAESDTRPPPAVAPRERSVAKLRFTESWRADVPGIDLRSMFLSGNRLIIGSSTEIACIERTSGQLLWSCRTHRAVSVLTPVGIARLGADGRLCLYDLEDGEALFDTQLSPCVGASASGAVVNAPGLPHMLLVAEGRRHLVALDLDSNELRWKRAVRPRETRAGGPLRLRRAGKLMLVSSGDNTLMALDLLTGEIVWRHCGDHRYGAVVVDRGELFALSSEEPSRRSAATLERIDPWTGEVRWRATLPRPIVAHGAPLAAADSINIITRDGNDDGERTGVVSINRRSGNPKFDLPAGLCSGNAGCLVVDNLLVANSDSGELVAIKLSDGSTRYRHVFASWTTRANPSDRPHSVQPVLRSGALFLPQSEVYVVRPSDGRMVGELPGDLVPDAMRVDERCGVYVAEASGYLAAYHALPSLSLVSKKG